MNSSLNPDTTVWFGAKSPCAAHLGLRLTILLGHGTRLCLRLASAEITVLTCCL